MVFCKLTFVTCIFCLVMFKALGQALLGVGLQNPKFVPVETSATDYEIRIYVESKWVSTSLRGMAMDEAMNTGFRRLFNYIQGNNQNKTKVEMTAPVTCRVEPGAGPACESNFTVSFYVPEQFQAEPPAPTEPSVFIETRKEFTAYVRTFGGFANEEMKKKELVNLLESLRRDAVPFVEQPYYTAGYDSPFKLTNRRNEVWILKQE
ncbi:heme-binding protein 2 isoform X1 [Synchiropus splendidus]|uniref:heme-binding protein 2 isoform X1 n=2 Tax=Synchiropus splendidus TaxID=270530 RepID=UPI00237E8FFD|nr:heme-binding protein 2 isoform X1 [Synchiropus splendidus]